MLDYSADGCAQDMLPLINGEMRTYQLKGVKWLMSLHKNGLNGILADQMGLGKTVRCLNPFLLMLSLRVFNTPYCVPVLGALEATPLLAARHSHVLSPGLLLCAI